MPMTMTGPFGHSKMFFSGPTLDPLSRGLVSSKINRHTWKWQVGFEQKPKTEAHHHHRRWLFISQVPVSVFDTLSKM